MRDAILVFGGGINADGTLPENSKARTAYAVGLWKRREAPIIVMSGRWSFFLKVPRIRTEAETMVEYAKQLGCPADRLFKEEESMDTLGNAYFTKVRFVIPRQWRRLLVVVADYHVPRTERICGLVFGPTFDIEVRGAPLNLSQQARRERDIRERASQSILDDWIKVTPGDHDAVWKVLSTNHPGYAKSPRYSREDIERLFTERVEAITRSTSNGLEGDPIEEF